MQRRESIRPKQKMARPFTISYPPTSDESLTNFVYMNPFDTGAPYVSIGKFVYRCAPHAYVQSGCIAMNSIQRQQLGKTVGDMTDVSDFLLPMVNFEIKLLTLEASSPTTDFANKFRSCFEGHVLTAGQKLVLGGVHVTVKNDVRGLLTMRSEVGVYKVSDRIECNEP